MTKQGKPETREERSARYERGDTEVSANTRVYEGAEAAARGRSLMESALDPAELAELDRLTRGGRPSVGASSARGVSPKRQVRLPVDLDAELTRRAEAEHRRPSEIMRDAIAQYLRAS